MSGITVDMLDAALVAVAAEKEEQKKKKEQQAMRMGISAAGAGAGGPTTKQASFDLTPTLNILSTFNQIDIWVQMARGKGNPQAFASLLSFLLLALHPGKDLDIRKQNLAFFLRTYNRILGDSGVKIAEKRFAFIVGAFGVMVKAQPQLALVACESAGFKYSLMKLISDAIGIVPDRTIDLSGIKFEEHTAPKYNSLSQLFPNTFKMSEALIQQCAHNLYEPTAQRVFDYLAAAYIICIHKSNPTTEEEPTGPQIEEMVGTVCILLFQGVVNEKNVNLLRTVFEVAIDEFSQIDNLLALATTLQALEQRRDTRSISEIARAMRSNNQFNSIGGVMPSVFASIPTSSHPVKPILQHINQGSDLGLQIQPSPMNHDCFWESILSQVKRHKPDGITIFDEATSTPKGINTAQELKDAVEAYLKSDGGKARFKDFLGESYAETQHRIATSKIWAGGTDILYALAFLKSNGLEYQAVILQNIGERHLNTPADGTTLPRVLTQKLADTPTDAKVLTLALTWNSFAPVHYDHVTCRDEKPLNSADLAQLLAVDFSGYGEEVSAGAGAGAGTGSKRLSSSGDEPPTKHFRPIDKTPHSDEEALVALAIKASLETMAAEKEKEEDVEMGPS